MACKMNRVTFMNESCHTYESVIVTHIIREYCGVMARKVNRVTIMNESCHTYVSHSDSYCS